MIYLSETFLPVYLNSSENSEWKIVPNLERIIKLMYK